MSATACGYDALREVRGGPTQTQTVQRRFAQRLRGAFASINAAIRRGIIERDVFNLRTEALADAEEMPPFDYPTDASKVAAFLRWLREQFRTGVLQIVGPSQNQYIRSAYGTGLRFATQELQQRGVSVAETDVEVLFNLPVHRSALQQLYTRTYENLQGITDDVADELRDELTRGFAEGHNPTKIARNLTERINDVGKYRATLLARSEIINAHSESTLNRYERAGVDTVKHGEWQTAGDDRVCEICESIDGEEHPISEMQSGTFEFEGREYRLKPPAHPQGRCVILPVVG